ncbi:G protein-activated inward rectifier potassium channel 3-like, partial [Condylostylus longicornis]|uniref:G protein-activated inward rectifier potassium channel 3-like n=1 Tax=Condylostylus longicornis TaxID=2530218 RepID=UPI00244E4E33
MIADPEENKIIIEPIRKLVNGKNTTFNVPEIISKENIDDKIDENIIALPSSKRRSSLFDTFHKRLRKSFKAVAESPRAISRFRQTRSSSRRMRKRVIFKNGDCNIVQGNVAKRRKRYMQDIFTTLVDAQWRWTLLIFALSFIMSWAIFAIIWWLIAYAHGDIEYMRIEDAALKGDTDKLIENETFTVCVKEVRSFKSAFLFSVETQHTIGYGNRYMNEKCLEAIFVMCLQCITGVIIQAFMVGIVFAKLSRPKKRAQTLLFSRNAVICHRDGVPCLMFRVADMRKSHILEAHVRAQIIRKKVTKEGEELPFYQQELEVGSDGNEDRLLFIWPTVIVHKINKHSPLYALSAQDMLKERFEIVVMLEGVVESTGMTTQARSSYLPSEILWGHRFQRAVNFKHATGEYEVDYTRFNDTYEVDTPLCSSKQLDEVRVEINSPKGLERLYSTGLLTRFSTISVPEPASDDSTESLGGLEIQTDLVENHNQNSDDLKNDDSNKENIKLFLNEEKKIENNKRNGFLQSSKQLQNLNKNSLDRIPLETKKLSI